MFAKTTVRPVPPSPSNNSSFVERAYSLGWWCINPVDRSQSRMPLDDMPARPSVDVLCVLTLVSLDTGNDEEGYSSGNEYGHNHAILPSEYPLPIVLKLLPIAASPEVG